MLLPVELPTLSPAVQTALYLAYGYHHDQFYGTLPYGDHLQHALEVGIRFGGDEISLVALPLHDAMEDQGVTRRHLINEGINLESIAVVEAVTDQPGETRKERKLRTYPVIREKGKRAVFVKLADRIANVEHGMSNPDRRMVDVYAAEHADLRRGLYSSLDNLDVMWDHLDSLFTIRANEVTMIEAIQRGQRVIYNAVGRASLPAHRHETS